MNVAARPYYRSGGRLDHEVDMTNERFIREPEVHRITGLSRTTRWRLEQVGRFPRKRKLSDNAVGWLASEIEAWMAERVEASAA